MSAGSNFDALFHSLTQTIFEIEQNLEAKKPWKYEIVQQILQVHNSASSSDNYDKLRLLAPRIEELGAKINKSSWLITKIFSAVQNLRFHKIAVSSGQLFLDIAASWKLRSFYPDEPLIIQALYETSGEKLLKLAKKVPLLAELIQDFKNKEAKRPYNEDNLEVLEEVLSLEGLTAFEKRKAFYLLKRLSQENRGAVKEGKRARSGRETLDFIENLARAPQHTVLFAKSYEELNNLVKKIESKSVSFFSKPWQYQVVQRILEVNRHAVTKQDFDALRSFSFTLEDLGDKIHKSSWKITKVFSALQNLRFNHIAASSSHLFFDIGVSWKLREFCEGSPEITQALQRGDAKKALKLAEKGSLVAELIQDFQNKEEKKPYNEDNLEVLDQVLQLNDLKPLERREAFSYLKSMSEENRKKALHPQKTLSEMKMLAKEPQNTVLFKKAYDELKKLVKDFTSEEISFFKKPSQYEIVRAALEVSKKASREKDYELLCEMAEEIGSIGKEEKKAWFFRKTASSIQNLRFNGLAFSSSHLLFDIAVSWKMRVLCLDPKSLLIIENLQKGRVFAAKKVAKEINQSLFRLLDAFYTGKENSYLQALQTLFTLQNLSQFSFYDRICFLNLLHEEEKNQGAITAYLSSVDPSSFEKKHFDELASMLKISRQDLNKKMIGTPSHDAYIESLDRIMHALPDPAGSKTTVGKIISLWNALLGITAHTRKEANRVLHQYVNETTEPMRTNEMTEKVSALYDRLGSIHSEIDKGAISCLQEKVRVIQVPKEKPSLSKEAKEHRLKSIEVEGTSASLLVQLLGDEFALHSQFEGMPIKAVLQSIVAYMGTWDSKAPFLQQLKRALELEENTGKDKEEALQKQIMDVFTTKEPCLIPGGWAGLPHGHAIYYEILYETDETATFRIFNTGDGIQNHPRFQVGAKEKVGYVEWRGVLRSNLENPLFSKSIVEMRFYTAQKEDFDVNQKQKTMYSFRDIYCGLKRVLKVEKEEAVNESFFVQPQRSGTCSCRALLAFLRSKMEENTFRRFKMDLRIQALVSYAFAEKGKISLQAHEHLIDRSVKLLSRKVERLYDKGSIGTEYLQDASAILQQVAGKVQCVRNQALENSKEIVVQHFPKSSMLGSLTIPLCDDAKKAASSSMEVDRACIAHLMSLVANFSEVKWSHSAELVQAVCNVRDLLEEAKENNEWEAMYFAVLELVKKIDLSSIHSWGSSFKPGEKKEEEAQKAIQAFSDISALFLEASMSCLDRDIPFAEKVYTLYKCYFVQNPFMRALASKYLEYPGNLLVKLTCASPVEGNTSHVFFQLQDEKMEEEMNAMVDTLRSGALTFFDTYLYGSFGDIYIRPCKRVEDHPFAAVVRAGYPEVIEDLKSREDIDYNRATYTDQDGYIYASEKLPLWIKNLRSSNLRMLLCSKVHLNKVSFSGRSKDIEVSYTSKQSSPSDHIRIRLPRNSCRAFQDNDFYRQQIAIKSKGMDELKKRIHFLTCPKNSFENTATHQEFLENQDILGMMKEMAYCTSFPEKEKKLCCINAKEEYAPLLANMQKEEAQDLLHIFINGNASLIEALEYFSRYPECLMDIDYQQIFQMACFQYRKEPDFILKNLQALSGNTHYQKSDWAALTTDFLNKKFEYFYHQREVKTCVFLLRMSRYFSRYKEFQKNIPDEGQRVKDLLSLSLLTAQEKSLIYAEQAAYFKEKKSLSQGEIQDLLIAVTWVSYAPIPIEWKDPKTEKEMKGALLVHSPAICEACEKEGKPNQDLLNTIYEAISNEEQHAEWERRGSYFALPNNTVYNPVEGRLKIPGKEVYLPLEICQDKDFEELFPHIRKAVVSQEGRYKFTDSFGHQISIEDLQREFILLGIKNTESPFILLQSRGNVQYQFLFPDFLVSLEKNRNPVEIQSHLSSRFLVENYHAWAPLNNSRKKEILLIKKGTDEVAYRIEVGKLPSYATSYLILSITRVRDGASLRPPSKCFSHIEHLSYVHEWTLKERLIEVELPRFFLSFLVKEERFESVQIPGFFIEEGGKSPILRSCPQYIPLVSKEGKKKAILLNQKLLESDSQKGEKDSLSPLVLKDQELQAGKPVQFSYFIYDVVEGKPLRADSKEAYFCLVAALSSHQEYNEASYYLRRYGPKLSAYSPQELEQLKEILKICEVVGDYSGEQIAMSLYVAYLLSTNSARSGQEVPLLRLYEKYLAHFRHITSMKLTKDEEIYIIKNILARSSNPYLKARLQELDPSDKKESKTFTRNSEKLFFLSFTSLKNWQKIPVNYPKLEKDPFENALLTRMLPFVRKYLCDVITLAIKGDAKEKEFLSKSANFLQEQDDEEAICFGVLLEKILTFPKRFLLPPERIEGYCDRERELTREKELKVWWGKILSQVSNRDLDAHFIKRSSAVYSVKPPKFSLGRGEKERKKMHFSMPSAQKSVFFKELLEGMPTYAAPEEALSHDAVGSWLKTAHQEANSNRIEQNEWARLCEDQKEFAKKKKIPARFFGEEVNLLSLKQSLEESKEATQKILDKLQSEILFLANKVPDSADAKAKRELALLGNTEMQANLEDVCVSYAQKNPDFLQKINPYLEQKDFDDLYLLIARYLELATENQQKERCLGKLSALEEALSPVDRKELEGELIQEMQGERAYDGKSHEYPAYLVFERYAGIMMRKEQVEKLCLYLEKGKINPVMEMIMGSGKSKVLLPLLGLLRADGKTLSLLIVPEPLFEDVASGTQETLLGGFAKSLQSLHFDRNTAFTKRSLEAILEKLQGIIERKECLIMTSKSLQSLLLKFVEHATLLLEDGAKLDEEMILMQEILVTFQSFGAVLVDEIDTIADVLHEVSFSLGNKLPASKKELHLIGMNFSLLYSDSHLKSLARLESDPNGDPVALPLSEKLYHTTLKEALAKAFLQKLVVDGWPEEALAKSLEGVLQNSAKRDLLLDYLCRVEDPSRNRASQEFYDSLPIELQDFFSLEGEFLCHFLPHTLQKESDVNYGIDEEIVAIPYGGAKVPKKGSFFSSSYITINYTFQSYFKNGIGRQEIKKIIVKLKLQAEQEIAESEGKKSLVDTRAWTQFSILKGELHIPFSIVVNERDLELLEKRINSSTRMKIQIIEEVFLPQMERYSKTLSCNPVLFMNFFETICGFTGTLWNADSMRDNMTFIPEAGTDAKTLNLLWKMSEDGSNVCIVKAGKLEERLNSIEGIAFDMISDVGGYFKEKDNKSIAKELSLRYAKPVIFYNEKGEKALFEEGKEKILSQSALFEENRLTFLDQSHTTGADVKQKRNAIGLVTIGRSMLLRDLLQGVWRLRGLEKGQKIEFIIDEEVEAIIRGALGLEWGKQVGLKEIIQFSVQNQAKRQGDDNYKSFRQKLWSIPQLFLLETLMKKSLNSLQRKKVIELLESVWVKPVEMSPAALFGSPAKLCESVDVLEGDAKLCKDFLVKMARALDFMILPDFDEKIENLLTSAKRKVHALILSPSIDDSGTVEIETQSQVQIETELKTETALQGKHYELGCFDGRWLQVPDIPANSLKNFSVRAPLFPLHRQMHREKALREYAFAFKDILISANILQWRRGEKEIENMRLFGPNPMSLHHLFVKGDEVKVATLDEMYRMSRDPSYYNLYLGFKDINKKPTKEAFKKIVKIKFLSGESRYISKELAFLKEWLEKEGAVKMHHLFTCMILPQYRSKTAAFAGSSLQRLFAELGVK
jgi:hypothetical protein